MRIDSENTAHYVADNGKVFKRISDDVIFGNELYLGYTYYINNVLQDPPHLETIDEYVEIDEPEDNTVNSEIPEENPDIDDGIKIMMLKNAKTDKVEEIRRYDVSSNVNGFFLNGVTMWIDKDTRVGLMNSTNIEKNNGRTNTTLWYNDIPYTLPCDLMIAMLSALELYALSCYNATAQHISRVKALENIEDVNAYDYTTGYPEKLSFNV